MGIIYQIYNTYGAWVNSPKINTIYSYEIFIVNVQNLKLLPTYGKLEAIILINIKDSRKCPLDVIDFNISTGQYI